MDVVGKLWKGFFIFHDNYKYYYIKLLLLFTILFTPLNAILNPFNWLISAEEYRMLMLIITILLGIASMFALIIYLTIWRVLFPAYWIVGSGEPVKAGRLYWSSEGRLALLGRRIREKHNIEGEPRDKHTCLINQGRLLNLINPWSSFSVLHVPLETEYYRGPTSIKVWEPTTRRKFFSTEGEVQYVSSLTPLTSVEVESEGVKAQVSDSVRRMVQTAQTASHADVGLTKRLLEDSAVYIPDDVKAIVEELDGEQ